MEGVTRITMEKLTSTYIYEDSLDRVFEAFTNPKIYNNIISDLVNEVKMIKGQSYSEVGAAAEISWKSLMRVVMEVIEVQKEKNKRKVVFRVTTKDEGLSGFNYKMTSSFLWNAPEFRTEILSEILFDQPISFTEEQVKMNEYEKLKIFKRIDDYLRKNTENLHQEESIVIKKPVEQVWEGVTDWNKFRNLVPEVAEDVIYDGELLKVDTVIHMYHHSKSVEYHLRIKKLKIDKHNNREYVLDFFAGKPRAPKQELKFKFISLAEDMCLLSFRHTFKEYVNSKQLKHISKEKLNILNQLKKSMEKQVSLEDILTVVI